MTAMPKNMGPVHFVGIGGIGMSGIAEILHDLGYVVQGSDIADGANVKRLRERQGMDIKIGHAAENIGGASVVVISSAVKADNPEVMAARAAKIPVIRRAEMLAELMRLKRAVAVAGTHGKTTTTSMVGEMLVSAGLDPTIVNGGIVNALGTNVRMGSSELMVVEADESDGTFTRLPATYVAVTNMDPEHMEHYGTFDNVKKAYLQFIENIPFYGFAVLCIDHPEVQALIPHVKDRKVVTYGFSPQADVQALNVRNDGLEMVYDVRFADWLEAEDIKEMRLPMLGEHNVQNSLVAIAAAQQLGVEAAAIKKGMADFSGVKRRFTKTGEVNGVSIIDDYAHHPKEIETVLKTARMAVGASGGKVIAVMQPHRYSRLHDLFEDFCTCFNDADHVLIADVYEAGESPIEGASRDDLVRGIAEHGHRAVQALDSRDALAGAVSDIAQGGDLVVCMGAGSITQWAQDLPGELEALSKNAA